MPQINNDSMFKLSYGLFVITAKGEKDNGCIINTAMQITDKPLQIAVCVNKSNFTHDMIIKSREFNLSVLSEKANFEIFKRFGFSSGRETDKFANYSNVKRSENGIFYVTESVNAFMSAKVSSVVDCGTHSMFVAEITEAQVLNDDKSVTYEYYFAHIKPKPEKKKKGFVCKICGYVYEGETLPEDFICPLCKHPASDFEELK